MSVDTGFKNGDIGKKWADALIQSVLALTKKVKKDWNIDYINGYAKENLNIGQYRTFFVQS